MAKEVHREPYLPTAFKESTVFTASEFNKCTRMEVDRQRKEGNWAAVGVGLNRPGKKANEVRELTSERVVK